LTLRGRFVFFGLGAAEKGRESRRVQEEGGKGNQWRTHVCPKNDRRLFCFMGVPTAAELLEAAAAAPGPALEGDPMGVSG